MQAERHPDIRPGRDDGTVRVLTPTLLEYVAVRCMAPAAVVTHSGVRLSRWAGAPAGARVVVCGLAGGLSPDIPPGTVVVPDLVSLTDGRTLDCDRALSAALSHGALGLGFEVVHDPLLTAPTLVCGTERQAWRRRGYVAADMETGLLGGLGVRVAGVRVVLDTPVREIDDEWLGGPRALRRLDLWGELLWLGRTAPGYALRAARVLQAGLRLLQREGT